MRRGLSVEGIHRGEEPGQHHDFDDDDLGGDEDSSDKSSN